MTEPSDVTSWVGEERSIADKETADGFLPVSEGDGDGAVTDECGHDGGADGEGQARVKLEGKGESYVLTLKVLLPGSSEPLTVMVSSTHRREGEEGGYLE